MRGRRAARAAPASRRSTSPARASSTSPSRRARSGRSPSNAVTAGEAYGRTDALAGQRLNLEFVSANPTGPVHIGGTRWAAVGDALGRLLEASGADVTREYYFNDAGAQIDRFARSLQAAAQGRPVPEDGYAGTYINDIAAAGRRRRARPAGAADDEQLQVFRDAGRRADVRRDPQLAGRLRRRLRRLLQRAHAARVRRAGEGDRPAARAGPRLRGRRRRLAADDGLRRRQGPRAGQGRRRARPTSPPTAPTTWTSASAASTRS